MTKRIQSYLVLCVIVFLLGITDGLFAQPDPTNALVGKWTGWAEGTKSPERILVIESVKPVGTSEWAAQGTYGNPNAGGENPQEMSVSAKNNELFIDFFSTHGRAPVSVKLVGANKLEGTTEVIDRGRAAKRKITFEKVAPKAGDVK